MHYIFGKLIFESKTTNVKQSLDIKLRSPWDPPGWMLLKKSHIVLKIDYSLSMSGCNIQDQGISDYRSIRLCI